MNKRNKAKLYLFGAGGWGKAFVQKKGYEYEHAYSEMVFFDNNPLITGEICGKFRIENKMWNEYSSDALIITSGYWEEIYQECILHGIEPIGIYDGNRDMICSYKEMCIHYKKTYENAKFIQYYAERNRSINKAADCVKSGKCGGIFENMTQVAIMLSNLCNYASIHPKCPASLVKEKEIMPSKYVYKILDELAQNKFEGIICFHVYNEPTMDPRLFMFIKYVKEKMPKARIMIYSNGYYFNAVMKKEYKEIGTDIFILTGYGNREFQRLIELDDGELPYKVLWGNLDERLNYYDEINEESNGICRATLNQVAIYSNGDVGTCCLDHRHPYQLGNVFDSTLKEVMNSERICEFQKRLLEGDRTMFQICQGCGWNL